MYEYRRSIEVESICSVGMSIPEYKFPQAWKTQDLCTGAAYQAVGLIKRVGAHTSRWILRMLRTTSFSFLVSPQPGEAEKPTSDCKSGEQHCPGARPPPAGVLFLGHSGRQHSPKWDHERSAKRTSGCKRRGSRNTLSRIEGPAKSTPYMNEMSLSANHVNFSRSEFDLLHYHFESHCPAKQLRLNNASSFCILTANPPGRDRDGSVRSQWLGSNRFKQLDVASSIFSY